MKSYIIRIKYTDGSVKNQMHIIKTDDEIQSLADRIHVYKVQDNVVDVQLLRSRLPNKFADPSRIRYRQATESPKFLLQVDTSGAIVTPAERELD